MFPPMRKVPHKIESEGCDIKVKRDKAGRVIGIKTNNKCSAKEIELFREQINSDKGISKDE